MSRPGGRWRGWVAAAALLQAACGGSPPETLGLRDGGLAPCPSSPNCVHTGDRHPEGTGPFLLRAEWTDRDPMPVVRAVVDSMPRTTVVRVDDHYLHAEARSRVFRFVDDLEVLVKPGEELVVRSASRLGQSDLGVNAARVETLRRKLTEAGLLR